MSSTQEIGVAPAPMQLLTRLSGGRLTGGGWVIIIGQGRERLDVVAGLSSMDLSAGERLQGLSGRILASGLH